MIRSVQLVTGDPSLSRLQLQGQVLFNKEMITLALLVIFFSVIFALLKKYRDDLRYFEKQNIKYIKPLPLFGNTLEYALGKKHIGEVLEDAYNSLKDEEVFGYLTFTLRSVVLRNPGLVERVLVRDFSHFTDRRPGQGEPGGPAEATLIHLGGIRWRIVRNKFSPIFTSSKLKYMFQSIGVCGKNLEELLDANEGQVLDAKDVMTRYTLDVIGSIAYGLDVKSLKNPEVPFKKMAYKLFDTGVVAQLRIVALLLVPGLLKALGLSTGFSIDSTTQYFCDVMRQALEDRRKSGEERPDLVQLMLSLKEKGRLEVSAHDSADDYLLQDKNTATKELEMTDDLLIGAGFSFIFAGFHSSAMSLALALYELARNPQVLQKARAELQRVCSDGVTYEKLTELKYLENVLKEAMRFYPTVQVLSRVCNKEYTLPTGLTLKPGDMVKIPVSALHKDPAYFPDPLLFNPDRFEETPIPGTYLPFGDGPRICIGLRFAMLEMKYCLAKILLKYNIQLADEPQPGPFKISKKGFLTTPDGPMRMTITKAS